MVSDESEFELVQFARALGLPEAWIQRTGGPRNPPHFDLSPRMRVRAIAFGAVACDKYGYVAAVKRYRDRVHGPLPPAGGR